MRAFGCLNCHWYCHRIRRRTLSNSEMKSSNPSTLIDRMLLRVSGFRLRVVRTVPNSPRPGSRTTQAMQATP